MLLPLGRRWYFALSSLFFKDLQQGLAGIATCVVLRCITGMRVAQHLRPQHMT